MVRQRVDVVSAIAEDARISVDVTDLGLPGDNAFETGAVVVLIRYPLRVELLSNLIVGARR